MFLCFLGIACFVTCELGTTVKLALQRKRIYHCVAPGVIFCHFNILKVMRNYTLQLACWIGLQQTVAGLFFDTWLCFGNVYLVIVMQCPPQKKKTKHFFTPNIGNVAVLKMCIVPFGIRYILYAFVHCKLCHFIMKKMEIVP